MKITDTFLRTVTPRVKPFRVFEKGFTKGFGVQVLPSGRLSFFLCHQTDKGTRYKTLGQYPELSLVEARKAAETYRVQASIKEAPRLGTLRHLCDYYILEKEKEGRKTTKEMHRVLYREVLGVLGEDKLAKDVTAQDVRKVLYLCIQRGSKVQSNRVRSYLRSAFQYGIRHDHDPRSLGGTMLFYLTSNPVDLVPTGRGFESVGERVLTLEELAQVWNYSGPAMSLRHLAVFKLIVLFCGLRPSEVTQAAVSEFDFGSGVWSIPPTRTKNSRWHVLPLTPCVLELLEKMRSFYPNATYLFPGRDNAGQPEHHTSFGHSVKRLMAELGMEDWSPRDLRRTCKTWAGYAGLDKGIRDRLLNHALTDVSAKHYDRHDYMREKMQALETWQKFLLEAVSK